MSGQHLEEHRIKKDIPNQKFGYQLASIFVLIIIIRFFILEQLSYPDYVLISVASILILMSKFKPEYINPIKFFWMKFSLYLAKILNPIILLLIFLTCFLPIGLFYKIVKRNNLKTIINKQSKTYWEEPEDQKINFEEQF